MKKKLAIGLLIAAGVLVLVVVAAGTVFYVKIYRPIASPLVAIAGAAKLEETRLQNHDPFVAPSSGELTQEQAANFVAVEEAVQTQLAAGITVLVQRQADLERANEAHALSMKDALLAFGDIKTVYLSAKMAQIDAMNKARLSKAEFEWVRQQLYRAAALRLSQVDASELISGAANPAVTVRVFDAGGPVPEPNERLARPLAAKLETWRPLGFFGL